MTSATHLSFLLYEEGASDRTVTMTRLEGLGDLRNWPLEITLAPEAIGMAHILGIIPKGIWPASWANKFPKACCIGQMMLCSSLELSHWRGAQTSSWLGFRAG